MTRFCVGQFTSMWSDNEWYNIYAHRGYKRKDKPNNMEQKYIFIGSTRNGNWFRYLINNSEGMITLRTSTGYDTYLTIPMSDNDLEIIFNMILPGKAYKLKELQYKSRQQIIDDVIVDAI